MNPAFCSFLGFTAEEPRQKHCVDFSPPEDAAKDWILFQQLRAGSIQEAIHNSIKHAGVNRVEVRVLEDSGQIHLIVRDAGCGFDVTSAMQGRGLGLISMQERVRLVGGSITIDSKPGGGTSIHVQVPLGSEPAAQLLAV